MLSICLLFCCSPAVIYAQIRFTDPAPIAGVAAGGEANGTTPDDYSGDGPPDLFVARLGEGLQPLLYVNQGDGGRVVGAVECVFIACRVAVEC